MDNQNLQIETCLERDEISLDEEHVNQYNQLVIDMGLENLAYKDEEANISPMNDTEKAVYKELCPHKVSLEKYNHHIPMRVMEALKSVKGFLEAEQEKINRGDLKFEVWTDTDPDPVLVAKVGWNDIYLIGRWGPELDTFNTLYKRAIESIAASLATEVQKAKQYVELYEKDPEALALLKLKDKLSSIYWS